MYYILENCTEEQKISFKIANSAEEALDIFLDLALERDYCEEYGGNAAEARATFDAAEDRDVLGLTFFEWTWRSKGYCRFIWIVDEPTIDMSTNFIQSFPEVTFGYFGQDARLV